MRKYLSSDASDAEKKRNIVHSSDGLTCLHQACSYGAPANIAKSLIGIGGKELVVVKSSKWKNETALHSAFYGSASYNVIKMMVDVGGNDLVMMKNRDGNTALHCLCDYIENHTDVAKKVKLLLEVGDGNILLSTKNNAGNTPFQIAVDRPISRASARIEGHLTYSIPNMNYNKLHNWCDEQNWTAMREFLSSDASDGHKKRHVMYHNIFNWTCLHQACFYDAPDDLVKSLIDIGGKKLVMKSNHGNNTALHWAFLNDASYNAIKMMVDVGGKDLVMMKNSHGNTAMHQLCDKLKMQHSFADKLELLLEVGGGNVLLSTKNNAGNTPLQIVSAEGASNRTKNLLTPQSDSKLNNSSSNVVPVDGSNTPVNHQHLNQQTTSQSSSSTTNDPNYQDQLKEAQEQSKEIQQDHDQMFADYSNLQDALQVERRDKFQLTSTLADKVKELEQSNRKMNDLEQANEQSNGNITEVETLRAENATLLKQKEESQKDNAYLKDRLDNLTQICLEHNTEFHAMVDSTRGEGSKRKYNGEHSTSIAQLSSKRRKGGTASSTTTVPSNIAQAIDDNAEMIMEQLPVQREHHCMLM